MRRLWAIVVHSSLCMAWGATAVGTVSEMMLLVGRSPLPFCRAGNASLQIVGAGVLLCTFSLLLYMEMWQSEKNLRTDSGKSQSQVRDESVAGGRKQT